MKISEFRKLIREEVRKVIKEGTIESLSVDPKLLKVTDKDAESTMNAIEGKYKLKLLKKINSEMADMPVEISQIIGTSYIVVNETGFGVIFKATDMPKVAAAIKDGSYFEMAESKKKVVKEVNNEFKTTKPSDLKGWVHAFNTKTNKYKMFPSATVALQKGFIYAIEANDVEFVEPEELEGWTDSDALENGWAILAK